MSESMAMIGLVEAGKTTFLAALYHIVETNSVPGSLVLSKVPPLREHLERIRRDWLSLNPQTRTTVDVLDQNILEMRRNEIEVGPFYFPDLSGEKLAALVEERVCGAQLANLLAKVDRLLLFIHPDSVADSPSIEEVSHLTRYLEDDYKGEEGDPKTEEGSPAAAERPKATAWDTEMVSTQVKLVDLVQICIDLSPSLKKVGVIISAWDKVEDLAQTPQEWLDARLPMLAQYLASSAPEIETRIYGVSATGGDLKKDRENLRNIPSPVDRIRVVGIQSQEDHRDITLPVKWLAN
jgi:hypothetical protein